MRSPAQTGFEDREDAMNRTWIGRARVAALLAGASLGAAGAARAASVDPTDKEVSLSEIVVTAQRRSELNQNVPITINTINAAQLKQNNINSLGDITKLTPAVRMDYIGNFAQPTIRGIGTAFVATGSGANVGLYIDGFYSPNALTNDFQLLNVENVQVLKGPQGTLFGRNTTGGAILVTTSEPRQEAGGVVEASYGSFNTQRYQGYVTGGDDRISADLAGLYTRSDGYVRNITTGSKNFGRMKDWSLRVGVKAKLTDDVTLVLRYAHNDVDDPTSLLSNVYVLGGVPQALGAIIPGVVVATSPREVSQLKPVISRIKGDVFQATLRADLGFATLTSLTQHRKETSFTSQDIDFSSAPIFDVSYSAIDKVFTQEFILSSNGAGPLKWTAGAFYFDYTNFFPATLGSISGGPLLDVNATYADSRSLAGYFDATYEVMPRLFLTAGLRYTHDQVRNGHFHAGVVSGGPFEIYYPNLSYNRLTPRLVLRYQLDEQSSVFASYNAGYKSGTINMSGPANVTIKPEKINAFEVGYKHADRRMTLDLSAYYYDYKNLQTAFNQVGTNVYRNAANSEIYGVESEFKYLVAPGLEFSAGGAYLHAEYKKYPGAIGTFQCLQASCGAGFGQFPLTTVDASGFEMQRSPKFTGYVNLRYTTDFAGGELGLSGNVYHTSSFFFDTSEQFPQAAYTLVGLRAEWTDPSSHYTVAVYTDNLTNEKYRRQILTNNFGVGAVWAPPRSFGASVRAKF
jgi:iron complex outermembrane receptor protein